MNFGKARKTCSRNVSCRPYCDNFHFNVRFWHLADIQAASENVRFWG
jgi:hypothetical protein